MVQGQGFVLLGVGLEGLEAKRRLILHLEELREKFGGENAPDE